jgi:hypothetical protein
MNDTPHPAKRDVVVTLSDDGGQLRCSWMLSIPADIGAEEALAGCVDVLLPMAIEAGDIEPGDTDTARFAMREADVERDADLYLQEAAEAGSIH